MENEKLAKDLKAVTESRSEADRKIKRLEGNLQETQTRLQDAERAKTEQSEKIKKLERELKIADSKRGGISAKIEPPRESVETVETASVIETKQTIGCDRFSDHNCRVTVSRCKRSVKSNSISWGYCFLNHQKIEKNQILRWTLRVPESRGGIGMVIILE